ncbi:MAG: CatB-related O-acetyltransferase [Lachnospiraceae bacterium]|nr:CatB-related O-acetyltransferase [Lachnospiraceae bacterium]
MMEPFGAFAARKISDAGSAVYRSIVFPFVKMAIERKCDSIIGKGAYLYKGTTLAGRNFIGDGAKLADVSVGYSTYIAPGAIMSNTKIGKYSCIGDVHTVIGRHPVKGENVAIHPAFYSPAKQFGYTYVNDASYEEARYADGKYNIVIGNDVWIGFGVMIVDGVSIGDGAVIGAGSLVTADVESYAIYAGTPAKKIGMRFDGEQKEKLLEIRWWEMDEKYLSEHADCFRDPADFIKNFKKG